MKTKVSAPFEQWRIYGGSGGAMPPIHTMGPPPIAAPPFPPPHLTFDCAQ